MLVDHNRAAAPPVLPARDPCVDGPADAPKGAMFQVVRNGHRDQGVPADRLEAGSYPGGVLVAAALQAAGITHAFGIPGTHNIELYDALAASPIRAILITDEQSSAFLCDGFARSGGGVACANVVPGAGVTHALSGIAEAFMDGVPLLVLTCGVRDDVIFRYQLHDIDQLALLRPVTKATFRPTRGEDIVPTILQAVRLAKGGCPGPVAVEIPANLYLLAQRHDPEPVRALLAAPLAPPAPDPLQVQAVARMLARSRHPLLHVGLGAAEAADLLPDLVLRTGALVSTTFSGKGVFDEHHPHWLWPGFGLACPAPLRAVAADSDAILILGARLGEVSTASYGITLPRESAHVDIDAAVPGATFPVDIPIVADARAFVEALLAALPEGTPIAATDVPARLKRLAAAHRKVEREQQVDVVGRVGPGALFASVQRQFPADTCFATDSGNGTFLAMEHLRLTEPRRFLAPTDFSCMGYCVPAAIGAALAHPGTPVVAFAGDGALLMTGLELLTAAQLPVPLATFVLRDNELGQIASFQRTLTNAAPCSVLPDYDLEALAAAVHIPFRRCVDGTEVEAAVAWARERVAFGRPCVVEVAIDYGRKTYFTRGVVAANFGRLPWRDRLRMVGRAVARRLTP